MINCRPFLAIGTGIVAAAVFALLVLARLLARAGPDELGTARDEAVHARLEMAAQERRLAAMMMRGTGASAAGCPGPQFVPAELASADEAGGPPPQHQREFVGGVAPCHPRAERVRLPRGGGFIVAVG